MLSDQLALDICRLTGCDTDLAFADHILAKANISCNLERLASSKRGNAIFEPLEQLVYLAVIALIEFDQWRSVQATFENHLVLVVQLVGVRPDGEQVSFSSRGKALRGTTNALSC